jgi:flagellar biosynthesis component FlhA
MPGHLLAMPTGAKLPKIKGLETKEPTFNLVSYWITEDERADAEQDRVTPWWIPRPWWRRT